MLALIRERLERQFALDRLLPDSWLFELPGSLPERIATLDAVEDAALALRRRKLGENPIPDNAGTLEDHGDSAVDAQPCKRFKGLSARVDGKPVIAVGEDWPGDRQRFTLAHELGHRVLAGLSGFRAGSGESLQPLRRGFSGARRSGHLDAGRRRHRWSRGNCGCSNRNTDCPWPAGSCVPSNWLHHQKPGGPTAWPVSGTGRHLAEPGEPYPQEYPQRFEQQVYLGVGGRLDQRSQSGTTAGQALVRALWRAH